MCYNSITRSRCHSCGKITTTPVQNRCPRYIACPYRFSPGKVQFEQNGVPCMRCKFNDFKKAQSAVPTHTANEIYELEGSSVTDIVASRETDIPSRRASAPVHLSAEIRERFSQISELPATPEPAETKTVPDFETSINKLPLGKQGLPVPSAHHKEVRLANQDFDSNPEWESVGRFALGESLFAAINEPEKHVAAVSRTLSPTPPSPCPSTSAHSSSSTPPTRCCSNEACKFNSVDEDWWDMPYKPIVWSSTPVNKIPATPEQKKPSERPSIPVISLTPLQDAPVPTPAPERRQSPVSNLSALAPSWSPRPRVTQTAAAPQTIALVPASVAPSRKPERSYFARPGRPNRAYSLSHAVYLAGSIPGDRPRLV